MGVMLDSMATDANSANLGSTVKDDTIARSDNRLA